MSNNTNNTEQKDKITMIVFHNLAAHPYFYDFLHGNTTVERQIKSYSVYRKFHNFFDIFQKYSFKTDSYTLCECRRRISEEFNEITSNEKVMTEIEQIFKIIDNNKPCYLIVINSYSHRDRTIDNIKEHTNNEQYGDVNVYNFAYDENFNTLLF